MLGYHERPPTAALRPWVAALWQWDGGVGPRTFRVVPDGCVDVIFTRRREPSGDACELELVGTMTRHVAISRQERSTAFGARLRPGAARLVLDGPARELTDRNPDLADVWGRDATRLLDRLTAAPDGELAVLEGALCRRLHRLEAAAPDPRLRAAVERILAAPAEVSMARVARDVALGARHLRRLFLDEVGVGPKRLARIVRFQNVLTTALELPETEWARWAVDAGYYDQAHLIRDFQEMTGLSPSRYLTERTSST